jgi:radical SAM-linked protein
VHRAADEAGDGRLKDEKVSLSVSSLRAYGLGEELLDEMASVRATGLTFAPEAGTQRMRDVVNKNVTEEQLTQTAERVFSRGWSKMKLYFMIGLPTETDEDVARHHADRQEGPGHRPQGAEGQTGPTVTVSVSTHVPKPHTPFQWCAMDTLDEIRRKQAPAERHGATAAVDLKVHESRGSTLEGALARGDRRLADVIEHAYRQGARFDSWEERLNRRVVRGLRAPRGRRCPRCWAPSRSPRACPGTTSTWASRTAFCCGSTARPCRAGCRRRAARPWGSSSTTPTSKTHQADARKLVCYDCGVACDLTAMRQERTVYLVQLGEAPPREKGTRGDRPPSSADPRANFDQGEGFRVRLSFERVGPRGLQGHLDLVRLVPRVFRRAEISMFYSQGFHPKPDMTFGPALALGIATLDEYVDVKLSADVDPERAPRAAAARRARRAHLRRRDAPRPERDPTLNKVIDGTRYVAAVPWSWLREQGLDDVAAVQARVDARRAEPMVAMRKVEGIGKKVDVGALLQEVTVDDGHDAMAAAGYAGALLPVTFLTRVTPNGAAKPAEVLDGLMGVEEVPARFIRVAQGRLDESGALRPPMDLDAHRKPPRVRAAPAELAPEATAIP